MTKWFERLTLNWGRADIAVGAILGCLGQYARGVWWMAMGVLTMHLSGVGR